MLSLNWNSTLNINGFPYQTKDYLLWMLGKKEEAQHYFQEMITHCKRHIRMNTGYGQTLASFDIAGVYAFPGEKDPAYHYLEAGSCHGMTRKQKNKNQFSKPVKNSVSVIINQYKATLKRWCNNNNYRYFQWQPRFYDNILCNENSIERTKVYIRSNPKNWQYDKKCRDTP